jgi:membrane fusion protein (multidrug efflux system)
MNLLLRHFGKIIILLIIAVLLVIRLWPALDDAAVRQGRGLAGQPVRTMIVSGESLTNEVISTGTVRAFESIDIQVEVSGKISEIVFSEGAIVSRGESLLKLDTGELQAQLRRAISRRDLADRQVKRLSPLMIGGALSKSQFDMASSELEVLQAEIELIQEQLLRREVIAPFDGVIGLRFVSEGSYVAPGTRIATFQNVQNIKIDFSLPERYSFDVRPRQKVKFSVTGSSEVFEAEIYAVEPRIEEATRTLLVRAEAPNPNGYLRPGAFARVVWQMETSENAILVPSVALMREADRESVFVVKEGKVSRRVVKGGPRFGERVLIVDGLNAGDEIIVAGIDQVKPKVQVSILQ